MKQDEVNARPDFGWAMRRALVGRCPNCGRGNLFASYLKPVAHCAVCEEAYDHIRVDDAAPWLTILAIGILIAPAILAVETHTAWPVWIPIIAWPLLCVGLALLLLPRAKALLIGLIWFTHAQGSGAD